MGIESDQLVYDYLSRVGDLAQQRRLPASERMRLVSALRNEIDRRRATHGEESPSAVRGILGALGTPDEVVERAEGPGAATPRAARDNREDREDREEGGAPPPGASRTAAVPKPRKEGRQGRAPGWLPGSRRTREGTGAGSGSGSGSRGSKTASGKSASGKSVPGRSLFGKPRAGGRTEAEAPRLDTTGSAAPHTPDTALDGDGLLDDTSDWWQQEDPTEGLPGFVGGVQRPDLFVEPLPEEEDEDEEEGEEAWDEDPAPGKRRRLARILLRRKAAAPEAAAEPEFDTAPVSRLRLGSPFVLLAALLLLGGALFGSLVALAAGWLLAYASRRLTPGEAKTTVLVIPGLAAASGVLWLWGRVGGRWGDPVAAGGEAMGAAVSETWPWVLRGAAVASALFLLWRARRH
ncbi:hypothetical protein ABT154_18270 [Streptomyces sp. NPDC001728]|uniref:hypothetical protein n=1 Tax=Streptomyces sp. NPDC001728 TaxID=3154396 RepID=UPI00332B1376